MSYFAWRPYVPVAEKRRRAERKLAKLRKQGQSVAPITIEGRTIAKSFWGQSWCTNLEHYSDYENRLPRGRTYVRNGSVLDLQIAKGEVAAMVAGSELYKIKIAIAPVTRARWKSICRDCAGTVDSLVELLQGRLAKGVMDRVCRKGDGLFPSPQEIKLSCSCPDWADMCKHVAAALYGVGARLDEKPELLFVLRGVDENELLAIAGQDVALSKAAPAAAKTLDDSDVAALFGLEMAETANSATPIPATPKRPQRSRPLKASKAPLRSEDPGCKDKQVTERDADQIRTQMGSPSSCPEKARAASTSTFGMTAVTGYYPVIYRRPRLFPVSRVQGAVRMPCDSHGMSHKLARPEGFRTPDPQIRSFACLNYRKGRSRGYLDRQVGIHAGPRHSVFAFCDLL